MSRTTVYEDDYFKLSFEEEQGEPFVHVEIYKATKKVLENILWEFSKLKMALYYNGGYDTVYTYTQDKRLFKIFNAEDIGGFEKDGMKFRVGKWELK